MSKLHIKSGDTVKVIAGKYKGKTGKVIQIKKGQFCAPSVMRNSADKCRAAGARPGCWRGVWSWPWTARWGMHVKYASREATCKSAILPAQAAGST